MADLGIIIRKALGKVGKVIGGASQLAPKPLKQVMEAITQPVVDQVLPPELKEQKLGLSDILQIWGAEARKREIEQNPKLTPKQKQEEYRKLEEKTIRNTGGPSAYSKYLEKVRQVQTPNVSFDPNKVSELKHERAMGANVGDIREFGGRLWRWTGEGWEPERMPTVERPERRLLSKEEIKSQTTDIASKYNLGNILKEGDIENIMKDIYEKGMETAEAIESRLREAAQKEWEAKKEMLERQKEEVATEAGRQRKKAKEEEEFYTGELEKRKGKELETIESQRKAQEKTYLQLRDDLGERFSDTHRQLEARFRAWGISGSSFASAESTKLLRDFNRNLATMAVKHKEALEELDAAHRNTVELYDSKITELQKDVRNKISDIDAWEREQIGKIQDNEMLSMAQKFERIADAINRADQIRLQVKQNYDQQRLAWEQWLAEMQLKVAQVANNAARDRMATANKYLDDIQKAYQAAAVGLGKWVQSPEGGWTLYTPSPYTATGWVQINTAPYTDEEKRRIEEKYMKPSEPEWMRTYQLISQEK